MFTAVIGRGAGRAGRGGQPLEKTVEAMMRSNLTPVGAWAVRESRLQRCGSDGAFSARVRNGRVRLRQGRADMLGRGTCKRWQKSETSKLKAISEKIFVDQGLKFPTEKSKKGGNKKGKKTTKS